MEKVLVLDFGGQYDLLIARRVRENGVFAEVLSYDRITPAEIKAAGYKGIIFTGGPNSVYDEKAPRCGREVLELGIPVLGICYGHQLIAFLEGGVIRPAGNVSEYGKTPVFTQKCRLFDLCNGQIWIKIDLCNGQNA